MTADLPAGTLHFMRNIYIFFFSLFSTMAKKRIKVGALGWWPLQEPTDRCFCVYKCSSMFCILQVNACSWTEAQKGRKKKLSQNLSNVFSPRRFFSSAKPLFEVKHLDVALCENPYKVNKPQKPLKSRRCSFNLSRVVFQSFPPDQKNLFFPAINYFLILLFFLSPNAKR